MFQVRLMGHGWTLEDGVMQPLWTDNDVLPQELVDILEETVQESENNTDPDEEEEGGEGLFSDTDDDDDDDDSGLESD